MQSVNKYIKNIRLYVTESEKNLQINDITATELESIWGDVCDAYPNFEIFFSFNSERMTSSQTIPYGLLENLKMEKIDDMVNFKLSKANFTGLSDFELDISLLTEDNFDEFAAFHDSRNGDMFWTSTRIGKKFDIWRIHILKKCGATTGYSMMMATEKNTEIFAVVADVESEKQAILQVACKNIFAEGRNEVLFMIDANDEALQEIARVIGFKQTGFYQGFRGIIPPFL